MNEWYEPQSKTRAAASDGEINPVRHKIPKARVLFRQFAWAGGHPLAWAGGHPILCACGFFVLAFALRLLLGRLLGPPMACFLPDERIYLHLARSIAQGGPLLIQGQPAQFQKILYPLLISPAFLLARNPLVQVKLVEVINCLAMASMVFPAALLVKKLSPRPDVLLLTLAFAVTLPDFHYTANFMSEPLYWPLCIWVFYFFHAAMARREGRNRLPLFALFGFFTYLSYLTKEVGAAFLIAGAAMLLIEGIRSKAWKQNGLALAVSIAAFFVPFLAVKQALFAGLGNSYVGVAQPLILFALKSPDDLLYMIYGAAALFAAAMLCFYILPVLLPLFGFRKMSGEKRRMYLFAVFSLAVTAGAIAATVYGWEERGAPLPRMHMRLLAPIAIPFVILCFDSLLSGAGKKQKPGRRPMAAFGVFMAALLPLLPSIPVEDDWYDHAALSATYPVRILSSVGVDGSIANFLWLGFLLLMLALAAVGVLCFLRGKKKAVLAMLLCAICALSAADNFWQYRITWLLRQPAAVQRILDTTGGKWEAGKYFSCAADILFSGWGLSDPALLAGAAARVNAFFQETDEDGRILICTDDVSWFTFETYASQHLKLRMLPPAHILEREEEELLFDESRETKGWRADYIVVTQDFNPFKNVDVIFEHPPYLVLRNPDPARLLFSGEDAVYG